MDEPTIETKREILGQERQLWINTRYQWEIRYRVYQRVGAEPAELVNALEQIGRCERAIDAIAEELKALGDGE